MNITSLDEWLEGVPEDEKESLCLVDAWNAAIAAALAAIEHEAQVLSRNNLDSHATGARGCAEAVRKLIYEA